MRCDNLHEAATGRGVDLYGDQACTRSLELRQAQKWVVTCKRYSGDPNAVVPAAKNE